MLINNFFIIDKQQRQGDTTVFNIELNLKHPIFAGHFPGRPIVPGVCSMEMIKECAAYLLSNNIQFTVIDQSKFICSIEPSRHTGIKISIQLQTVNQTEYVLKGTISNQDTSFVTLKSKIVKI